MKKKLNNLKDTIAVIKRMGAEVGMEITEEEIARKMNMPWEQFEAYVNGEVHTPDEILSLFWSAWPDLLKNTRIIRSVKTVEVTLEEELDEDGE